MHIPGDAAEITLVIKSISSRAVKDLAILPVFMFSFASRAATIEKPLLIEYLINWHRSM